MPVFPFDLIERVHADVVEERPPPARIQSARVSARQYPGRFFNNDEPRIIVHTHVTGQIGLVNIGNATGFVHARSFAAPNAGSSNAAGMSMMARTTRSPIKMKAHFRHLLFGPSLGIGFGVCILALQLLWGIWRNPSNVPDVQVKQVAELLPFHMAVHKGDVDAIGAVIQRRRRRRGIRRACAVARHHDAPFVGRDGHTTAVREAQSLACQRPHVRPRAVHKKWSIGRMLDSGWFSKRSAVKCLRFPWPATGRVSGKTVVSEGCH